MKKYDTTQKGFSVRLEARLKNAALIRAREQAGIKSGKEVARLLGISASYYSLIERMGSYPPRKLQEKICGFYREKGLFMLEEDVFPKELKKITPRKYVIDREIPVQQLISLDQVNQKFLPYIEGEIERNAVEVEQHDTIKEVLGTLTEKEQRVIELRFGIGESSHYNKEPKTLEEVAEIMHVSPGRIRQIESKALRKLRYPTRAGKLKDVLTTS